MGLVECEESGADWVRWWACDKLAGFVSESGRAGGRAKRAVAFEGMVRQEGCALYRMPVLVTITGRSLR